jgi:hypothetical protein
VARAGGANLTKGALLDSGKSSYSYSGAANLPYQEEDLPESETAMESGG